MSQCWKTSQTCQAFAKREVCAAGFYLCLSLQSCPVFSTLCLSLKACLHCTWLYQVPRSSTKGLRYGSDLDSLFSDCTLTDAYTGLCLIESKQGTWANKEKKRWIILCAVATTLRAVNKITLIIWQKAGHGRGIIYNSIVHTSGDTTDLGLFSKVSVCMDVQVAHYDSLSPTLAHHIICLY